MLGRVGDSYLGLLASTVNTCSDFRTLATFYFQRAYSQTYTSSQTETFKPDRLQNMILKKPRTVYTTVIVVHTNFIIYFFLSHVLWLCQALLVPTLITFSNRYCVEIQQHKADITV